MNISVVIPNWNGKTHLQKNLPHVLAENPSDVIVVDDRSQDESVSLLESEFPQVRLLQNQSNRNFAFTVNRGVTHANSDLVCILNTDVQPKSGFLKNAPKYFEDPKLFGVTLHESGFGPSLPVFEDGFIGYKKGSEKKVTQSTFWLSGGSCIVRRSIWDELGGFDDKLFPFYWDDLDISYRASKRGYKLLWVPDCRVDHQHETFYSQKYPASKLAFTKEVHQLTFIWKNLTQPELFIKHLKGLANRIVGSPGYSKVFLSTISSLPLILNSRQLEAKQSVISDSTALGLVGKGIA